MLATLRTDNSPFNEREIELLRHSLGALDVSQSQWLSGYLAGRLPSLETAETQSTTVPALTILFGSETGNGEAIATRLANQLNQTGIKTTLESMGQFRVASLKKLEQVVFVISTHGEGDPPEEALELFDYLQAERAPELPRLNYRILALGDQSYEHFCLAGQILDQRLRQLGATAVDERIDCDVDYHRQATRFTETVVSWAEEHLNRAEPVAPVLSLVPTTANWNRQSPYAAEVLRVQRITGDGSVKDIHHLEISLEGAGLEYLPGDSLGVWARNDSTVVDALISGLGLAPDIPVRLEGEKSDLISALTRHRELTRLTEQTIRQFAQSSNQGALGDHFNGLSRAKRRQFIESRQLLDLVEEYPANIAAQDLVDLLRPLAPRSYSIASSRSLVDDEVHLTVATLNSNAIGRQRTGVASGQLNQRLQSGDRISVFVEPNRRFRLPDDPEAPVIMIAAGTGIAPFRAFMQDLEATGAHRNTWLIFGNPSLRTDFIYQREWLNWRKTGLLNRIDAAWSRDGVHKHYVQHVVCEQIERLDRWLSRGAHVYLCGSLAMGRDVLGSLQSSIATLPAGTADSAAETVKQLGRTGRLHKDLY